MNTQTSDKDKESFFQNDKISVKTNLLRLFQKKIHHFNVSQGAIPEFSIFLGHVFLFLK